MLAMLEGPLKKIAVHSGKLLARVHDSADNTTARVCDEASTPSEATQPRYFRFSHADGSASALWAATTLALAASGVPAGCGFHRFVAEFARIQTAELCKFSYE